MISTPKIPDHPFCEFVSIVLNEAKVQPAIASLQQRLGLNVNILLFCCWFATSGQKTLTKKDMQDIILTIEPWREKISAPIHKLHTTVNNSLKNSEIADKVLARQHLANKIEQLMLAEKMIKPYYRRSVQQKFSDVCHNIATYCKELKTGMDQIDNEAVKEILRLFFPDIKPDQLAEHWGTSINKTPQSPFKQPAIDELL